MSGRDPTLADLAIDNAFLTRYGVKARQVRLFIRAWVSTGADPTAIGRGLRLPANAVAAALDNKLLAWALTLPARERPRAYAADGRGRTW